MDGMSHRQQDIQGSTWIPLMAKNRSSIRNGSLNFTSPTPEFIPPLKTRAVGKKTCEDFSALSALSALAPSTSLVHGLKTSSGWVAQYFSIRPQGWLDVDQETGG